MTEMDDDFAAFDHLIETIDEIETIIGTPMAEVANKEVDHVDDISAAFIAASPFCLIATTSAAGPIDLSPKGDPPGFVRVLSKRFLLIPDRPGNRRVDSFHNLMRDPRIGLIFLIPGKGETLRVRGRARLTTDPALLEASAIKGRAPKLGILVRVDAAFMHCPKCILRSHLWQKDHWHDVTALPDIGAAMIRQSHLDMTEEALFEKARKEGITDLY